MARQVMRALAATAALVVAGGAAAEDICTGYGPQTPRDITGRHGENSRVFALAPPASRMNLCDLHTHTHAEHRGPGFSLSTGGDEHGGWRCNDSGTLTEAELADPWDGDGPFGGVAPGDTIEVHWVFTSCEAVPGPGLGSCLTEACVNPDLRVEAQVFLVVNDPSALDFRDFAYGGTVVDGYHQPKALPAGTGEPVVFAGSTTGPSYSQAQCSPLQVTWSVRPQCARLHIGSLHAWAEEGNVFGEDHSHGVRSLVTAPELLAPIR